MCLNPGITDDGQPFACRKCGQCLRRRVNDWVGRNIAERRVSDAAIAVTLTYGRNEANEIIHERTVALTYSDYQRYMKLLRRHGYDVRYFVTGEYGSLNNRAHWHALLYFKGSVPPFERLRNFSEPHWPHGWSYWDDKPEYSAIRYCVKYVLKSTDDAGKQGFGPMMSKKPPIGAMYFRQLAEQLVAQGLGPRTLEYSFPDVRFRKKNGREEVMRFWLQKRSAELFLDHYLRSFWRVPEGADWVEWLAESRYRPIRDLPNSELLDEYLDKRVGEVFERERDAEVFGLMAKKAKSFAIYDLNDWFDVWTREAKNEQERQARQAEWDRWVNEQWYASGAERFRRQRWPEIDWGLVEQAEYEQSFD